MNRYNICYLAPQGYSHSAAFIELAELVCGGLSDLGHHCDIRLNSLDRNSKNIIIGGHLLESLGSLLPNDSIIINTEQLGATEFDWERKLIGSGNQYEIWDYSHNNIEFLGRHGIHAKKLHLGYHKNLERIAHQKKDIDILFYGCINKRREAILRAFFERGLNVQVMSSGVYGCARDAFIARSKLVLNIHYHETKIMESVRIFYLLINRVPVLCEMDKFTAVEEYYRQSLVGGESLDLPDIAADILSNPEQLDEIAQKGYDSICRYPQGAQMASLLH